MCTLSASHRDHSNPVLVCWPNPGRSAATSRNSYQWDREPRTRPGHNKHALNPYQHQAVVGDSATCPNQQCIFKFAPVPQGQRLVVTHISAQLGPAQAVLLENGGTTLFVPKGNSSSSFLGSPVTYYINSGDTPTARIFYPNATDHTSLIVDLVGYLVPN